MAYVIQDQTLTDIADAIREKTGKTEAMTPLQMPDEILSIQGGDSEWDAEPPETFATYLYIEIPEKPKDTIGEWPFRQIMLSMYCYPTPTIDWGDSNITTDGNYKHIYEKSGRYIIKITPPNDVSDFYINTGSSGGVIRSYTNDDDIAYRCILRKAFLGSAMTELRQYNLYECYGLNTLVINTLTKDIPNYFVYYSYSLTRLELPATLETISENAFNEAFSLIDLMLPANLTTIERRGIYCGRSASLQNLYVKATIPPNLASLTSLNVPNGSVIYVPTGTLEAYQSATNWSEYADQMQEWEVPTE